MSCPNFLDKRDPVFKQLHGTLDSHFQKLHEAGTGRKVKLAELITKKRRTSYGLVVKWEEFTNGITKHCILL